MKLEKEETKTVKQFIIILAILIVIALVVYFVTAKFVNKDSSESDTSDSTSTEYIDPTKAIVGTMLNKDGEYYVILYSTDNSDYYEYANMLTSYKKLDGYITTYTVDLANYLNKNYVTDGSDTNPKSDNLSELKFNSNSVTVIKVKDNKITNAYEGMDAIKKVWKVTD